MLINSKLMPFRLRQAEKSLKKIVKGNDDKCFRLRFIQYLRPQSVVLLVILAEKSEIKNQKYPVTGMIYILRMEYYENPLLPASYPRIRLITLY